MAPATKREPIARRSASASVPAAHVASSSRFDRIKRESTARGIWQRHQTPRGYSRNPDTRRLVPNGDADAVREAFTRRADGDPVVTVAADLGMTPSGLRQLLRNRVYLGVLVEGPYENPSAHEPLVSKELWEAAQPARRPAVVRSATVRAPALLATLIRCAACGHVMTRSAGAHRASLYKCVVHHSGDPCPTPAGITANRVERYVEDVVLQAIPHMLVVDKDAAARLAKLRSDYEQAMEELQEFLGAVSATSVGREAFRDAATVRRNWADAAAEAVRRERDAHVAAAFSHTHADGWQSLDVSARNATLRAHLDAVVIKAVGRGHRVSVDRRVAIYLRDSGLHLIRSSGGMSSGIHPLPVDPAHPAWIGLSSQPPDLTPTSQVSRTSHQGLIAP